MSRNEKDDTRFERFSEYTERSTLIVLGVTVTVLAGFLSQVWGSGGVEFRTDLAQLLRDFGSLFVLSFSIPVLTIFMHAATKRNRILSMIIASIAVALNTFVVLRYLYLFTELGNTIIKFAKLPTP